MSRTIVVAAAAVLGAALLASLAQGQATRTAARNPGAAACASGSVPARIGGRLRCLRPGQRCQKRYARQYRRHGFVCRNGRLRRVASLPTAGKIVATIHLHPGPMGTVFANDAVWVAEHNAGTVARIDPATNKVVRRVEIPSGQPARLAAGREGLWHLPYSDNTLQELDPATNQVSADVPDLGEPDENCCSLAVGAGSVWVPKGHFGLYRVDAASHKVVAQIPIDNFFGSVFGLGSIWGTSGGNVFRLDPATNSVSARIAVPGLAEVAIEPGCCPALALGLGAVWVGAGKKVARVDPNTNTVSALISVPAPVDFVAASDDSVWVVGTIPNGATRLWRIDPATSKVVAALTLSFSGAADLTFAAGSLWITLFHMDELIRVRPAALPAG
jgi:streptogramin lyase